MWFFLLWHPPLQFHINIPHYIHISQYLSISLNINQYQGGYVPFPYKGDKFNLSFFPNTSKMWNSLPKTIQIKNMDEFKIDIKNKIKPKKYKHFARGNKLGNTLLTRIRVGRSYLNQHKFTIGHIDSPECLCHFRSESTEHYFLDCFLYTPERQTLMSLVEHYVPFFKNSNKKKKLDILLNGVNIDKEEFLKTNTILTKAVQNFILSSRRFSVVETID